MLVLPGGTAIQVPGLTARMTRSLSEMPAWKGRSPALERLASCGLLAPLDLPLHIEPAAPRDLNGWTFR